MVLYVIRHAQSTNNALVDRSTRVPDPGLTDLGLRQADILSSHLAAASHPEQRFGQAPEETGVESVTGYGIHRLFCSAMHRSLLTALPVGRALDLAPEIWVDIHECGGLYLNHTDGRGKVRYPGLTRETIAREFSNMIIPPEISSDGWWDPRRSEEDLPACQDRAVKVADRLRAFAQETPDDTVAMISHAGFIEALIKALTNQPPGHGIVYHHFNTALTRMDFTGDDRLDIRYINRVPHLSNELVS